MQSLSNSAKIEKIHSSKKTYITPHRKPTLKRQLVYALSITAALATSVIPAYANPVAPSSRSGNSGRAPRPFIPLLNNVSLLVFGFRYAIDSSAPAVSTVSSANPVLL